jgi:hypothetical protein
LILTKFLKLKNDEDLIGNMINKFWNEFEDFQGKKGVYMDRPYIFKNHSDLLNNKSFLWHKKESERFTEYFGAFACRVCSKILGIGSAEQSWGDVKQLKDNKRSHLSGDRVKNKLLFTVKAVLSWRNINVRKFLKTFQQNHLKFGRMMTLILLQMMTELYKWKLKMDHHEEFLKLIWKSGKKMLSPKKMLSMRQNF